MKPILTGPGVFDHELPRADLGAEDVARAHVANIGRDPREARGRDQLGEAVRTEVEVVVAEGIDVEPGRIEAVDHVLAAKQRRQQRGCDVVAVADEEAEAARRERGALLLDQAGVVGD